MMETLFCIRLHFMDRYKLPQMFLKVNPSHIFFTASILIFTAMLFKTIPISLKSWNFKPWAHKMMFYENHGFSFMA